jgi:Family of unknown function (DUF6527)
VSLIPRHRPASSNLPRGGFHSVSRQTKRERARSLCSLKATKTCLQKASSEMGTAFQCPRARPSHFSDCPRWPCNGGARGKKTAVGRRLVATLTRRRSLQIVDGDTWSEKLPLWTIVMARDDGDDWSVGMRCPCSCGQRLEMMVPQEVKPRWDVSMD